GVEPARRPANRSSRAPKRRSRTVGATTLGRHRRRTHRNLIMPIRINLLAEMQALEELRRKDPVKRAVIVGVALVVLLLSYGVSLMVKKMSVKSEVTNIETQITSGSSKYKQVLDNQQSLVDGRSKLASMRQLTTNRFLL